MRNNHLTTLHILLVLTFITAGFNLMGYGLTALMLPRCSRSMPIILG